MSRTKTEWRSFLLERWLLLCTACSAAGWIFAGLGILNTLAYAVFGLVTAAVLIASIWRQLLCAGVPRVPKRRWRRPLPLIFAVILLLSALGGALYAPTNYDALTYRIPQLMHWLAEGRWHWIAASDPHLNITSPGYGWLMAPLLALTHSDRLCFLPNLLAFAFLPGTLFSMLRGCGVAPRVAWWWMWMLPTGACYAMQAGSIGNDLLATSYAVAAMALAFRARESNRGRDIVVSALAAALATGVKIMLLPLALPWLLAAYPALRRRSMFTLGGVALMAAVVSFVPTAGLNWRHTGSWAGDPDNLLQLQGEHPAQVISGNVVQIGAAALAPPVWPLSHFSTAVFDRFTQGALGSWIVRGYPRFRLWWGELASEEESGIGLGVGLALALFWLGSVHRGRDPSSGATRASLAVAAAGWIGFGVFLVKVAGEGAPRLAAPYYPFLLAGILRHRAHSRAIRNRRWHVIAALAAGSIIPALMLSPARPLWPSDRVLAWLQNHALGSAAVSRAVLVYGTYAERADLIAPLRPFIPSGATVIGFVPTNNDIEAPLWKPYGSRRVIEVMTISRHAVEIRQLRGSVIIASARALAERFHESPDTFAAKIGGKIVGTAELTQKAKVGPEKWFAIALNSQAQPE